ncbi:MAG: DNA mismatch repair endonuclease MutL [Candidatus Rokubacteria bacterium]|nr:DNA mismatch repair endonuclease MutL [Candidatus Rokubacteria bacterium]
MTRIRRLPEHLVNKIAAGEVVERPASVVKELCENALDAEARSITVDLRDGGASLIRVTDDGIGIRATELPLALERHATSKLSADEDLDRIVTLGFRGEALPAICAVSRFTLVSRTRSATDGVRLAGEGGTVTQHVTVPAEPGTTVEVRDLFHNTPARLKFLKTAPTELAACLRVVAHLALAHPEVFVRVASNGRATMTLPAARDLRDRLGALWGWDIANRLLRVDRTEHGVTVHGYASPPDVTRGARDEIVVTINARPVRDPALIQAVLEAYRPLLPRDRFPWVCLSIALAATDVDVNVHPTKAYVRFRHPRLVHEMIVAALGEALRARAVMPTVGAAGFAATPAATEEARGMGAADLLAAGAAATGAPREQTWLFAESRAPYGAGLFGRVLGQVQSTFIVSTSDQEVFFVDQHVAHERVIFERLTAELAAGAAPAQALLFAEPLDLAPAGRALLERWREPLERLGFAFEGFGGQAVLLRAVPSLLKGDEPRRLIEAAIDDLGGPRGGEPSVDRALAFVACRAAVKAGMPLAHEEMERLITDLGATLTPFFCPHGRPVVSRIALSEIRRELRRSW